MVDKERRGRRRVGAYEGRVNEESGEESITLSK